MNKLLLFLGIALCSFGSIAQIRFSEVDPANHLITIKNFGSSAVNIQNYNLCALFEYSSLSGLSVSVVEGSLNVGGGATVTIEWLASSGFNTTASDLGLYLPGGGFSNPANMVDFMQYGAAGQGREGVANAAGIWQTGTFLEGSGPWVYTGNGTENFISFWSALGGVGCTAPDACNYDITATVNDGSCLFAGLQCDDGDPLTFDIVNADCVCVGFPLGCTDPVACNFDSNALENDFSCVYANDPCDDANELTINDTYSGDCTCIGQDISNIEGCTEATACNYNPEATVEDASCIFSGESCDDGDSSTINDVLDGDCVCTGAISGCTETTACNYSADAGFDDGSCYFPGDVCDDLDPTTSNDTYGFDCVCSGENILVEGCTEITACNYNPEATIEDASCIFSGESCDDGNASTLNDVLGEDCVCAGVIGGCMEITACNYAMDAGFDDGSCFFPGDVCDDQNEVTFNDVYGADCVCAGESDFTEGCMNMDACNYNANATVEDGSCIFPGEACDDGNDETINDLLGSDCICAGLILGCTDFGACNFNANADIDNGVCFFTGDGCDDGDALTGDDAFNADCVCEGVFVSVPGCTIPGACNFNADANEDDGSCITPGDLCDDNNDQTVDDIWSADCVCAGILTGCTEPAACNYNVDAVIEDFTCAFPNDPCDDGDFTTINDLYNADCGCVGEDTDLISGCTDTGACNFNPAATIDDGSCLTIGGSCDDNNPLTVEDIIQFDCVCAGLDQSNFGCTNPDGCNYSAIATVEDGSCIFPGEPCDDNNENSFGDAYNANCVCAGTIVGCTDVAACNYEPAAAIDNGNCFFPGNACDDGDALTENDLYAADCVCSGTDIPEVPGCMDMDACNYNADANVDDGSCLVIGAVCDDNDPTTDNDAVTADCVCIGEDNGFIAGCMNSDACNYDMTATVDDGSCFAIGDVCDDGNIFTANDMIGADCICSGEAIEIVEGCTAIEACNFNPDANFDDGSCQLPGSPCDDGDETTLFDVLGFDCVCAGMSAGCMEPSACNYDPQAMFDDQSCVFPGDACDDGDANTVGDVIQPNCGCEGTIVEVPGCTSPLACNFNPEANLEDGSCFFVGQSCDDGNANTSNDVYNANCECEGVVSVEEISSFYSVYPNPTNGIITIAQREGAAIQLVEVVDITGKNVATFNPNASITTIDLSAFAQGLYTLNIRSNNEVKSVRVQKN